MLLIAQVRDTMYSAADEYHSKMAVADVIPNCMTMSKKYSSFQCRPSKGQSAGRTGMHRYADSMSTFSEFTNCFQSSIESIKLDSEVSDGCIDTCICSCAW